MSHDDELCDGRVDQMNRWTGERIARLGFLVGLGWSAKRVAVDPIINSTSNNVHRQAQRFGLSFRSASIASDELPEKAVTALDAAAAKRGVSREKLIWMMVREMDAALVDNILDDDTRGATA